MWWRLRLSGIRAGLLEFSYEYNTCFRKRLLFYAPRLVPLWPPHRECNDSSDITSSAPTPFLSTTAQIHLLDHPAYSTMRFHLRKPSFSVNVLAITIFVFYHISQTAALGVCSRHIYGSPRQSTCEAALVGLPRDTIVQYFVEQQLRRQPGTNWLAFADPRLPGQKQNIVEVPKWWSRCSYPIYPSLHPAC